MLAPPTRGARKPLLLALAFATSGIASAQSTESSWEIAPRPPWVQDVEPPADTQWLERAAPAGRAIVLVDRQIRLVDGSAHDYVHVVERITSETGVLDAGQRQFTFQPPHERLLLHELSVRRGDRSVSSLKQQAVQIMQREAELESANAFAGALTALVVLHDLRVGDVIESSFSIAGSNPVLEGHFHTILPMHAMVPLGAVASRVITDRKLELRYFANAPHAKESRADGMREYVWRLDRVEAVVAADWVPPEHDLGPWVQISDLSEWADVVAWGQRVFEPPERAPPSVAALAREIATAHRDPEPRMLAALRRVQDDVRYFALALAESSHRPAPPDVVLERRFGDCKDKSLLLVTLLRELGLEAYVALVASDGGAQLSQMLPAIGVFDHAIVVTKLGAQLVWLDPTAMFQRGSVNEVAMHEFRQALVLAPATRALTAIAAPRFDRPELESRAHYRIPRWDGPVELELVDVFHGRSAERIRAFRAVADESDLRNGFTSSVRAVHGDAQLRGPLRIDDRESENAVEVVQRYVLEAPWEQSSDGSYALTLRPFALLGGLPMPEPERTAPLALEHRGVTVQDTVVDLPERVEIAPESHSLQRGGLHFESRSKCTGATLVLHHRLQQTVDRIEAHALDDYRGALDDIERRVAYQVWSSSGTVTGSGRFNWLVFGVAFLWSAIVLIVCAWWRRAQPYWPRPNVPWTPELVGLRGWLVWVGLGLFLALGINVLEVWHALPLYGLETWNALTDPSSARYEAANAPILLGVLLVDIALAWGRVLLIVLYFQRARSWPLTFVVLSSAACALHGIESVALERLPDDVWAPSGAAPAAVLLSVLPTVLWIAYVLRSRRVRSTFLPPPTAAVAEDELAAVPIDPQRIAIDAAARDSSAP